MTATSTLVSTDSHGKNPRVFKVARTDAAEAAAIAYLTKHVAYTIGQPYRVFDEASFEIAEDISDAFAEFLHPTCEHGMSLSLCMGPMHFPSAEQERALWG